MAFKHPYIHLPLPTPAVALETSTFKDMVSVKTCGPPALGESRMGLELPQMPHPQRIITIVWQLPGKEPFTEIIFI